MKIERSELVKWHSFPILMLVSATFLASQQTARTPIRRDEVQAIIAADLRSRGFDDPLVPRVESLELPGAITATPNHSLHMLSVCWDRATDRAQFRLECRVHSECLPFIVSAHLEQQLIAPASDAFPACQIASAKKAASPAHHDPVVRVGDSATVVFHGDRMRLAVRVTCLERGAEGEVVRVRNQDGHVFRARVAGPALLEAVSR